jgi:hypothetical protein
MDFDHLPSRPVVKSQFSAQEEWDRWLLENNFKTLVDQEGLTWNLVLDVQQLPNDLDRKQALWVTSFELSASVDAQTFISTGTLDPDEDSRLIALLGTKNVPLKMKPVVHEAKGEKEAKDIMMRVLPELRENIRKTALRETKRRLIGKWIDSQTQFGAKEAGRGW